MSIGETNIESAAETATQSGRIANNAAAHRERFEYLRDEIKKIHDAKPWGADETGQDFEANYLGEVDMVFDFAINNCRNTEDLATNCGVGALRSESEDEHAAKQIESATKYVDDAMADLRLMADDSGGDPGQLLSSPGVAPTVWSLNQLAQDSQTAEALGDERVAEIDEFVDGFSEPSA